MRIHIEGGRLLDPANNLDAKQDLFIADGKIVSIKKKPDGFDSDLQINAKDKIVLPGLVDLCARLREPGLEYKGTIQTESLAANSSGITSICCPPDTDPVIDTPAIIELIHQRSRDAERTNIYPLGALTKDLNSEHLAEMHILKQAGCVGVSNAYNAIDNAEVLRRAFEYAHSCNLTVFLYAEDHALKNNGVVHEGALSTRLGLPPIPETAETVAICRAILLAEQTQVHLHFCRLSTARGVQLIKAAQAQGLPITADVAICNLLLTEMDIADYNSDCHLQPPLRSERDRSGLIAGINDGTITAVCSDHQPHDVDAKAAPFSLTESGASTIEHLLPLMMHLVNREELKLEKAISLLTSQPANILSIDKGSLEEGKDADVCIFDNEESTSIDKDNLLSIGKNTPFNGWETQGAVSHTLLNGRVVFDRSEFK
ncbi:MAG TPA: dihydroorotase [Thiotrichaceae bacterium]|jgi:dihydroorotase|nr:dihydroorotase [Thiotrichaceae bacterium]HIM07135.1 dihydroorotase [Gammaproteobacteria bacterium]